MNALLPQNRNALYQRLLAMEPRVQEIIQSRRMVEPESPLAAYGRIAQQNWNSRPQGWGIRPAPMVSDKLANKRSSAADFGPRY